MVHKIKAYYNIIKPGIIYGNLLSLLAGYLFASNWHIQLLRFIYLVLGSSLVIAGACVFNNILDRKIDSKMNRTKKRALVQEIIKVRAAFYYGLILSIIGFLLLTQVNNKVLLLGTIGFLVYVLIYGYLKRTSTLNTIIGSISGAIPITSGYVAVSNSFNNTSIILFLILASWQMAHFYSIALYRLTDYKKAGLKMAPLFKSAKSTKLEINFYILIFGFLNLYLVSIDKSISPLYIIIVMIVTLIWLFRNIKFSKLIKDPAWGKKSFKFSLVVLIVFSIMLSLAKII